MLKINQQIFKAYDIRGIYNKDFDDNLAFLLGQAFVRLINKDLNSKKKKLKIGIAYDMRLSSPALRKQLIKGLKEAGADVVDLGLIATPTFYFAVSKYKYDGGIIISASHNPGKWNGFKLVRGGSKPITDLSGINFLRDEIEKNNFLPAKKRGLLTKNKNASKDSLKFVLRFLKKDKLKKLKIVVDSANGMGAVYLKPLFKSLKLDIVPLNFKLDGTFPAHEADPLKEENTKQLREAVLEHGADLGIATDGDGDRVFFIDNEGQTIPPGVTRGLLSKLFLQGKVGAKIGYDVRPGRITQDLILENNGVPVVTRVGHSLIKEQMIKEDIYFAAEFSGHFYLNTKFGCYEYPEIVIIKLLEHLSKTEKTLAEIVEPYKKYFSSGEINRDVEDKEEVLQRIKKKHQKAKISLLDGVSVDYKNYWFNVRASNTENKIRLNLEAVDEKTMKKKTKNILSLIY